jgi:hypothetical protein
VLKRDAKFAGSICRGAVTAEQTDRPTAAIMRNSASAGFPNRSAIFQQALPKHEQGHESRQHQRCDHHLNNGETGRVFAKKPASDNSADPQQLVGGPSKPIKHIASPAPLVVGYIDL